MIKSFSLIVLTHFFHFKELKILRQPGYLLFKVKPTIFFLVLYLWCLALKGPQILISISDIWIGLIKHGFFK